MCFRLVPQFVTLNDVNGVMAVISRYVAEFGSFCSQLRKSGRLGINIRCFAREMSQVHHKHDGCAVLFTVAELLVTCTFKRFEKRNSSSFCFILLFYE